MGKGSSKPPSKASDAKWLRNYTFLLDENYCGKPLQAFLLEAGWRVRLHSDVLPQGVSDRQLLETCAAEGLVLVTPDGSMRHSDHLDVIRRHKLVLIVLSVGKASSEMWPVWGSALVANQHSILRALRFTQRPFCVRIRVGTAKACEVKSLGASAAATARKQRGHREQRA